MYEKLKQDGIANGMCRQFREEWQDPDVPELCMMYFRGMDFCTEHDWPKIELIRETFNPEDLAEYGIFIKDGDAKNKLNVAVLGDSEVHVYVPMCGLCDVYARHNSRVHLHLGLKAFCYVNVFEDAKVFVDEKEEPAKIKVSQYGGHIFGDMYDVVYDKRKEK